MYMQSWNLVLERKPEKKNHKSKGKKNRNMNTEQTLEFHEIKRKLTAFAHTEHAKQQIQELTPYVSLTKAEAALRDTTEGKKMIETWGNPPADTLQGVWEWMHTAKMGGCLTPEELEGVRNTLTAVKRMKDYLRRCKGCEISLPYYEENLEPMEEIRNEISSKIRYGSVDDHASPLLENLRRNIVTLEEKMRTKAEQLIRVKKSYMADYFTTIRNGHVCVPVKKEYRNKVPGAVLDKSATGNTLFMEPSSVSVLFEELQSKKIEESNEELRILYILTDMLADKEEIMKQNFRIMEKLDFIFAKAKLSMEYQGICPSLNTEHYISLEKGRHPLMDPEINVPLDFQIGKDVQGVVITGPNTGGKTIAIKTVALNCLMAQCGLHVACKKADICMNDWILCDIGDGQNLTENLSTFSAHITNVLDILEKAGEESLVIMDELGSGTDPTEGMGIAVAILEELLRSKALFLVTTHYPEVKQYAEHTKGILNARMTFDKESLKPLYQLVLGEAGESCAFHIAQRLGMPERMLKRAKRAAYEGELLGKEEELDVAVTKKHTKKKSSSGNENLTSKFKRGDSVMVYPDKKIGIVCTPINERGVLQIQMPGKKIWINHKRVKLHVAAEQLYPKDYDFSIVFDTVENRKIRHDMERKYVEGRELMIKRSLKGE